VVEFGRAFGLLGVVDRDDRGEDDFRQAAAVAAVLGHRAGRVVLVGDHDDALAGAQRQVSEHVAFGERGDQELFGVPALGLPAEGGIGAAEDDGLAGRGDVVVAAVAEIAGGARAGVAGPLDGDFVVVFAAAHGGLLPGRR
jgi:hypothetical protein